MLKDIKGNIIKDNDILISGIDNREYKVIKKGSLFYAEPLFKKDLYSLFQSRIDFNEMIVKGKEVD